MTEMNERDDEANVPRGPWRRLLEDPADGPPETTDARIRAAARRDLKPREPRWWIPAALAASFVLAVVIVRSEIGTGGRIPIAATERGGDAAKDARIIDRNEGEQAREPGQVPTAPARERSKQREDAEPDAYGYADSELGEETAGTGPIVGGPERELKAASEMPEERIQPDATAPSSGERANLPPAAAAAVAAPAAAAPADNARPQAAGAIATPPTPEAWYAAIEKLRSAGRTAEADRELERLKKAWPGWLEAHLAKEKPP
jgi:hypothetical protein